MKQQVFFALLAALLVLLSSGCSRTKSLMLLEEDVLNQEKGYQSLAVWRIEVTDRTGSIESPPTFFFAGPDRMKEGEDGGPVMEYTKVAGEWMKEDKTSRLEATVVAEAQPGPYLFKYVQFYLYTAQVANYWSKEILHRDIYLTVPIGRTCTIAPGKLAYLGTIRIEVLPDEKHTYSTRVHISQDSSGLESTFKEVQRTYPLLARRFKNQVDTPSWKLSLIEDFKVDRDLWKASPKDKYLQAYFDPGAGQYVLQSRNTECHESTFKSPFDGTKNVDIELAARWKSGIAEAGYGMTIGNDPDNFYRFQVTGNGQAAVELFKNGEHRAYLIEGKDLPGDAGRKAGARRQTVEMRGDTLRYVVNGNVIGEIKSELDLKEWSVGVTVCGKQTVGFDRLTVREP